jgi:hypothetical protein
VTNRFDPDTAMPNGLLSPVISDAFTVAPEVVYSPIVLFKLVTNRFDPITTMPSGPYGSEISEALTVAPEVVNSPIVLLPMFVSKISRSPAAAGMTQKAVTTAKATTRTTRIDFEGRNPVGRRIFVRN